jgi:ABC-2 type transport system permease protein
MKILFAFLRKELIQIRRDKKILPILIVAPLLQLIILGYAATFDIKNINISICDMDNSKHSKELIDAFTNTGYFRLYSMCKTPSELDGLFLRGRINSALIIPQDFERAILSGSDINIPFFVDGTEGTTANVALSYARQIINNYFKQEFSEGKSTLYNINYELRIWHNPDLKSAHFMIPAIFAILLSIIAMLIPSMAIVKEKETGTIEQLYVTPIKPYQIILGKMLTFMLISIVDVILVMSVAIYHFGVPFRGSVIDFAFAIILFLFSTLGIATFFSTITHTQQQAMMSVMFLFFLPSMLLSGFIFPVENIPFPIRGISYILPLTYFIEILRSIFLKGSSFIDLMRQYSILGGLGITIFIISLLKFKKQSG